MVGEGEQRVIQGFEAIVGSHGPRAPRECRLTCHGRVAEAFALPREIYQTVPPQAMDDHDHLPGVMELSISELSLSVVIKTSIGVHWKDSRDGKRGKTSPWTREPVPTIRFRVRGEQTLSPRRW